MHAESHTRPVYKAALWAGSIATTIPTAMFIFSAGMKLAGPPQVVQGFEHLGYPQSLAIPLAVLELACTVLYLAPRTSVLGAILLTGYLGGAIASHVRIGEPFIVQALLGVLVWLGLFLRDARLRDLIPLRS